MPEQPETPSQRMNRIIREAPARRDHRQQILDALTRGWTRPAPTTTQDTEETDQ